MTENDTILCQTEIRDWRIAEDSAEDLVGRQTEDWVMQASHSAYHGLTLTLKAPDGSDRVVDIEIDQGNVVVRSYRGDEPDAKMIIAADATYVSPCSEVGLLGRKFIRYEPEDADFYSGEVPINMSTLGTEIIATGENFRASLEWIGEGRMGTIVHKTPMTVRSFASMFHRRTRTGNGRTFPTAVTACRLMPGFLAQRANSQPT
jgi:hypothetical protein